jgi:cytidylate kinase
VIVTISRQAASRGEQVARRTADRLGIPLVNPEVVARAALRLGLAREDLSIPDRPARLGARLARIALDIADEPGDVPDWALIPQPSLYDAPNRQVIETMVLRLAELGACVIAGYPAQILLPEPGRAVHALVVAPFATRVHRMVLREDLTASMAERVVRESDRDRREFYRRIYDVEWGDAVRYDCVLNTAHLSVDEAAEVIVTSATARFGPR